MQGILFLNSLFLRGIEEVVVTTKDKNKEKMIHVSNTSHLKELENNKLKPNLAIGRR